MKNVVLVGLILMGAFTLQNVIAHQGEHAKPEVELSSSNAEVMYLGNAALLVKEGKSKVLFDPFFHNHYNQYQLVPEQIRASLFSGEAPFNDIQAIFVSHAHGDHFAAQDTLDYLSKFTSVRLYAPQQAVKQILELNPPSDMLKRISSVALQFGEKPVRLTSDNLIVEAVRIPHAGWPGRADIENLIFRVSIEDPELSQDSQTVMHMGDADPDPIHYQPFTAHWQNRKTNTAFPPYWFYFSADGRNILDAILNVETSIGVHVPVKVPVPLVNGQQDYFSQPGETRQLSQ